MVCDAADDSFPETHLELVYDFIIQAKVIMPHTAAEWKLFRFITTFKAVIVILYRGV